MVLTNASDKPLVLNPLDCQGQIKVIQERNENRLSMLALIKGELIEGTDYGSIPVYDKKKKREIPSKPFLFKSGTIKVLSILGLTAKYQNIELYEELALAGKEIGDIILRCQLLLGEVVVAEGVGARSKNQDMKGNGSFSIRDIHKALAMAMKAARHQAVCAIPYISELFVEQQSPECVSSQQPSTHRQITALEYEMLRQAKSELSLDYQTKIENWLSKKGYDSMTLISYELYSILMNRINNLKQTSKGEK